MLPARKLKTFLQGLLLGGRHDEVCDFQWCCPRCAGHHVSAVNLTRLRRQALKEGRLGTELTFPCSLDGALVCMEVPLFAGERDWEFLVLVAPRLGTTR